MNRVNLKYIIDVGMLIFFVSVFITGVIKFLIIQKSLGAGSLGVPLHQINFIHDSSGIALGFLILMHLILNFGWIIAMTKRFLGNKK